MIRARSNRVEKRYIKQRKADRKLPPSCAFCELDDKSDQYIASYKHFKVLRNIFPYNVWDNAPVIDHLMLVPLKHTDDFANFSPVAAGEFLKLLSHYEADGYNVYARTPHSGIKSVAHQHTHLIKVKPKQIKAILHVPKPHLSLVIK